MIQAGPSGGGDIMMQAGQITESSGISRKIVTSRKETIGAAEETAVQFDPRASRNIISAGHINMKAVGDLKMNTLGCASMHFAGQPLPLGMPLVKNRMTSLAVGTKLGNIAVSTKVGSIAANAGGGFGGIGPVAPGSIKLGGTLILLN